MLVDSWSFSFQLVGTDDSCLEIGSAYSGAEFGTENRHYQTGLWPLAVIDMFRMVAEVYLDLTVGSWLFRIVTSHSFPGIIILPLVCFHPPFYSLKLGLY